jgi:regulatory protein
VEDKTKAFIIQQILPKLEKYCAFQERSIFDAKQKLLRLGVEKQYWQEIISRLQNSNFINEERFVELFIRSKINQRSWGPVKITLELKRRGIDSGLIEQFSHMLKTENQHELLGNLLRKKLKSVSDDDVRLQREKLIRFAISKGYETSAVFKAVDKLLKSNSSDFEEYA